jgi:hypothetical protein
MEAFGTMQRAIVERRYLHDLPRFLEADGQREGQAAAAQTSVTALEEQSHWLRGGRRDSLGIRG